MCSDPLREYYNTTMFTRTTHGLLWVIVYTYTILRYMYLTVCGNYYVPVHVVNVTCTGVLSVVMHVLNMRTTTQDSYNVHSAQLGSVLQYRLCQFWFCCLLFYLRGRYAWKGVPLRRM